MTPAFDRAALGRTRGWEYGVRFLFGGLVTAGTGMIAHVFGPEIGGLFLAFPAVLPATLTLVEHHDGARQAADEARGAMLGALGLVAFAAVAMACTGRCPP